MVVDHSPVRSPPASDTSFTMPLTSPDNQAASSGSGQQSGDHNAGEVSAIQNCKLPTFWKDNPEMWFLQAESVFQSFNVRADNAKYHLIVSNLTSDAVLAVTDIIKTPPATDKYNYLKTQLINRLADSADKQLHKVLAELELGGRKPSELLRLMRSMVGAQAPENVLRVRWLALLPPTVQKLLRVFQATSSLDELATGADTLMESGDSPQFVMAAATHSSYSPTAPQASSSLDDAILTELRGMRKSLDNLALQQKEVCNKLNKLHPSDDRSRSRSRGRSTTREPHVSPAGHCYYHHNYGNRARRCVQPCTFKPAATQSLLFEGN
ncbi:uncharacterized protein [Chelonus insularis]|uniref:uncharacterized protein n=1 Tax=Chelonus insularis TaxID=460826 RepID=UPI0015885B8B|nr:uncharacterized protein LOC118070352 [Chelonus insularis]